MTVEETDAQLSIVIYGEPGVGKSRLSATAPGPRLVLDAEGSHRFIRSKKIVWNPTTEPVPEWDGEWETCRVQVLDWDTFEKIYEVLRSGKHPFKSIIIDTLTELQKRLVDDVAGVAQPTQQQWGAVLRSMDDYLRKVRDLLDHPTNPLTAVVIVAHASFNEKTNHYEPLVKGSIAKYLPGHFDVVGYMFKVDSPETGETTRHLLVDSFVKEGRTYVAKDRTEALSLRYGKAIPSPRIDTMLVDIHNYLNTPEEGTP